MKLALSADHRGVSATRQLADRLRSQNHEVTMVGTLTGETCDYPDAAFAVGELVRKGEVERGILLCGSGIGMCIAANKIRGVRAALVHDELTAEMSRSHNDANVLCLSAALVILGWGLLRLLRGDVSDSELEIVSESEELPHSSPGSGRGA